jgi:cytochrome c oxidase subunit II
MSHHLPSAHHPQGRDAGKRLPARRQQRLWRGSVFVVLVISVLGVAGWLIWSPLAGRRAAGQQGNIVTLNADMAGFSMRRIEAKVGQPITVVLRSLDTPYHSDGGGKHQFAIDDLAVNIVAPSKGTAEVTFTPTQPGTYQFYCDICCGGRANPTMQGELVATT